MCTVSAPVETHLGSVEEASKTLAVAFDLGQELLEQAVVLDSASGRLEVIVPDLIDSPVEVGRLVLLSGRSRCGGRDGRKGRERG